MRNFTPGVIAALLIASASAGNACSVVGSSDAATDTNATVPNGETTNGDVPNVGCVDGKCDAGKTCNQNASCASGSCIDGSCAAPRPNDGIRNGDESDVDCGGSNAGASRCAIGKACATNTDCASNGCSYKKLCTERPSCTQHFGGDTCGAGEPDDPNPQHEDCCRSIDLPMPSKTVVMDKYQITAGRFRVFLDDIKGDVRSFVKQKRPKGWDPTWDDFVPNGWDVDPSIADTSDPDFMKRAHSSVWHQLGGSALLTKVGRDGKPFQYGCFIKGNGVHTYRMSDQVQTAILQDVTHEYTQAILDAKALNCVTSIMLMAFCEWDWPGSRLPTYLETRFAWDGGEPATHKFPWGNTPAPGGYDALGKLIVPQGSEGMTGDPTVANWHYNYSYPTNPPAVTRYPDFSAHLAAPGRFPKGNGPFGHADIAGNLFDLTSTISGSDGQHPDNREVAWGRNGAWEGHNIPFASYNDPWTAPIMRKYGKAGGRCVK